MVLKLANFGQNLTFKVDWRILQREKGGKIWPNLPDEDLKSAPFATLPRDNEDRLPPDLTS